MHHHLPVDTMQLLFVSLKHVYLHCCILIRISLVFAANQKCHSAMGTDFTFGKMVFSGGAAVFWNSTKLGRLLAPGQEFSVGVPRFWKIRLNCSMSDMPGIHGFRSRSSAGREMLISGRPTSMLSIVFIKTQLLRGCHL